VRFRLHVLTAKNNKGDFIYAPKASSNVEDAVLKVISKDCALQCDWTALKDNGFEIHAFLPKPSADGPKIANHGAFISINSRPVSNSRGTIKQVVAAHKERLRKSNSSLANVKDPFLCMNIICPSDSYDPNIEPAKDDVMFDDAKVVLDVVDKLLKSYYPEAVVEMDLEPPPSAQQHVEPAIEEASSDLPDANISNEEAPEDFGQEPTRSLGRSEPRWRSSMYGIDEDHLEHLQEDQPLVLEWEEGLRAADVSNPWTIARMNAIIKPKTSTTNGQLLSPAKSYGEVSTQPTSPAPMRTPLRSSPLEPLTPQTSSRAGGLASVLSTEQEKTTQRLGQRKFGSGPSDGVADARSDTLHKRSPSGFSSSELMIRDQSPSSIQMWPSQDHRDPVHVAPAANQRKRKKPAHNVNSYADHTEGLGETWFGRPMRGTHPSRPPRRQKRRQDQGPPLFPISTQPIPRRSVLAAADATYGTRLYSEDNTDIRDFFSQDHRGPNNGLPSGSSFTPINGPTSMQKNTPVSSRRGDARERPASQPMSSGATSFETSSRLSYNEDALRMRVQDHPGSQFRNIEIYEDDSTQVQRPRPFSADSQRSSLSPIRFNNKPAHSSDGMAAYFQAYQDCEQVSPDISSSLIRRQASHIAPPHELASKTRPQRRRTTDAAQRSKSSKLPLERVPHGYHIQDLVMNLRLSVAAIIQTSRKLDMRLNSLEYNCVVEGAFDIFAEAVSERKIVEWVMILDDMLHEQFERLPGADVRRLLHEAIQRGLDTRREDDVMDTVKAVEQSGPRLKKTISDDHYQAAEHGCRTVKSDVDIASYECNTLPKDCPASLKAQVDMSGFESSRYVSSDNEKMGDGSEEENSVMQTVEKTEEEYGADIEDDMLLDL
jgi:hypothetical protein